MKNLNEIGLDPSKSKATAEKLNLLLANYTVFYQNTRGLHWHIKGKEFFVLHDKYEELYTDLEIKIDEVAERILTLGHSPEHRYSKYLEVSTVPECQGITEAKKGVEHVLDGLLILLSIQRDILEIVAHAKDEGTVGQMGEYIQQQEKQVWMYTAYLNK